MSLGYNKTPLSKKLGIKEGYICRLIEPFRELVDILNPLPKDIIFTHDSTANIVIWCCNQKAVLENRLPEVMDKVFKNGCIWVCWYKKSSKKQDLKGPS